MQFSLRTLLVVSIIVGLSLATITANVKLRRERERMRETYGYLAPVGDSHRRFELLSLTSHIRRTPATTEVYLLRIGAPELYDLEYVYYDGTTQLEQRERIPLDGPEAYITFGKDDPQSFFYAGTTKLQSDTRGSSFLLDNVETFGFTLGSRRAHVSEDAILTCFFHAADEVDRENGPAGNGWSVDAIEEECRRRKIMCAYFRIVKKK